MLERDLKNAKSKQGDLYAKNEPLMEDVETVQPAPVMESKQTVVCQRFSDDNKNVTVSNGKRSVKYNGSGFGRGYCFLKHPKIKKNEILKWSIRVPKFYGLIGMVIILKLIIFDFLKITFQSYWYICQSTEERMEWLLEQVGSEYYYL